MENLESAKLANIYAEFQYLQDILLADDETIDSQLRTSYSILMYQACSMALTDILKCLLAGLERTSSETESAAGFRSSLLYDCLATAKEYKHADIVAILLEFIVSNAAGSSTDLMPLYYAVCNYDVDVASLLINCGVNVNQKNSAGETALHAACDAAIANVLLTNGADVNALTEQNQTPLYFAFATYRLGVIRELLNNGANPNIGSPIVPEDMPYDFTFDSSISDILFFFRESGRTLHDLPPQSCVLNALTRRYPPVYPMCSTCKTGNQHLLDDVLGEILNRSANDHPFQESPLRSAVAKFYSKKMHKGLTDTSEIEKILSNGDSTSIDSVFGATALYYAVKTNLIEVAKLLLTHGADPNLMTSGKYPLIEACRYLSNDFAELLLDGGADPNVIDRYDDSPLFIATSSFDHRLVKMLVERGADVNRQNKDGKTALHAVIISADERFCPSNRGTSAIEIVKCLLANGFNVNHRATVRCDSLLSCAAENLSAVHTNSRFARGSFNYLMFELLLEHGADMNLVDVNGNSSLCIASQCPFAIRELLRRGGNPNWTDEYGRSLTSRACKHSSTHSVRILLAAGADPNKISWDAFVCSAEDNNIQLIDLLLNNGVRFDVSNDRLLCSSKPPEVITLREFYVPFCLATQSIVRLFKAGSNLRILATCCADLRNRMMTMRISCFFAGLLCQAVVLAGYKVPQQQLVELLKQSEHTHARNLGSWFERDSMIPPSLLRLSRIVIRRQLSAASGCRTILPLIDDLPITNVMQMYLKFEGPFSEIDLRVAKECDSCSHGEDSDDDDDLDEDDFII